MSDKTNSRQNDSGSDGGGFPLADHNVVVSCPGSGKTEAALWLQRRGLAAGIAAGSVAVWAGDPKSRTGLAHGPASSAAPSCVTGRETSDG